MGWMRSVASTAAALAVALSLSASDRGRTVVRVVENDDDAPRLGYPVVRARVEAADPGIAGAMADALTARLVSVGHVRPAADEDPVDYDLVLRLGVPAPPDAATLPFSARLVAADARVPWAIEGEVEIGGEPPSADDYDAVVRNVVARLIVDGWVAAKYDPDHPPPAAPRLGRTD